MIRARSHRRDAMSVAMCLVLAGFANCRPQPTTLFEDWRRIYSSDQTDVFILKKPGLTNLLIYVGFGAQALLELETARPALLKSGYNILTFTLREPAEPQPITQGSPRPPAAPEANRSVREFVDFAGKLTGYRRKVLVVPGKLLPDILASEETWSGLVVLRPGDAPFRDPKFITALGEIPAPLDIFWLSSGQYPEYAQAVWLAARVPTRKIFTRVDQGLGAVARPDFRLALTPGSEFENYLLLHHLTLRWTPAPTVFAGGCSLRTDGRRPIVLDAYRASSGPDRDICPLFLKRDEKLFRAGSMGEGVCAYPQAYGHRTLYCRHRANS